MQEFRQDDPRWGGNIPWFLQNSDFKDQGDFLGFFYLSAARIGQFFSHNEIGFKLSRREEDLKYFFTDLKNKTFHKFEFKDEYGFPENLIDSVVKFFHPHEFEIRMEKEIHPSQNFRRGFTKHIYEYSPEIQNLFLEQIRDVLS